MGPLIGSHVDAAGGLATRGLAHAAAIGAEVIQVFASNPRGWASSPGDTDEDEALAQAGQPVFVHAPYLVNLGSGDAGTAARSAEAVRNELDRAARFGARGVVVHAGSASRWGRNGSAHYDSARDSALAALDRAVPGRVRLVHANDSAYPCGSRRDRHVAIGAGLIGLGPFGELVRHPLLADVPFVAETPKASQEGDLAALRQLRDCRRPA